MRDEKGQPTRAFQHICWDGCMFPNAVMMKPQTWNDILAAMIAVRDAHGWQSLSRIPIGRRRVRSSVHNVHCILFGTTDEPHGTRRNL